MHSADDCELLASRCFQLTAALGEGGEGSRVRPHQSSRVMCQRVGEHGHLYRGLLQGYHTVSVKGHRARRASNGKLPAERLTAPSPRNLHSPTPTLHQ